MKVLQKSNWVCSLCNAKIVYDMKEVQTRYVSRNVVSMLPNVPTRIVKIKISYLALCNLIHLYNDL